MSRTKLRKQIIHSSQEISSAMVEQLSYTGSHFDRGPINSVNEIAPETEGQVDRDGDLRLPTHTALVADAYSEGASVDRSGGPDPKNDHLRSILADSLSGEFGQFQIILDGDAVSEDGSSSAFSIEEFFGGEPANDLDSEPPASDLFFLPEQPPISIEEFFGVKPSPSPVPEPNLEPYNDDGSTDDDTGEWSLEEFYRESGSGEIIAAGDMLPFPPRQPGRQLGGSEFFRDVLGIDPNGDRYQNGVTGLEREKAILRQVEVGNIPDFLRRPQKVVTRDANGNTAELSVMPDYLAIGTNEDWVRVPITPILARAIADRYGLELPTRKVADAVYSQADVRLTGEGMVGNSRDQQFMQGNGFYLKHNQMIDRQLGGTSDGALVAGHKKDIIFSRYAASNPDRLDFYGLFRSNGTAIQDAGGGPHDNLYVDYSHGARFVGETVVVNGQPMRYSEVLSNPRLAGLLSDEGTVDVNNIYRQPKQSHYRVLY